MKERRHVKVKVSFPLLQQLCTVGAEINVRCTTGLPADAELVYSGIEAEHGGEPICAFLVFSHESFEDLPPMARPPDLVPVFETLKESMKDW